MLASNRSQHSQRSENVPIGKEGHAVMETRKREVFMDLSNTSNFLPAHTGAASRGKARLGDDLDDTIMQGTTPARMESISPVIDWKDTIPPEDRQDLGDPQFVAEYVNPIFVNMNGVEQKYRQSSDYMQRTQNDITQRMRAVLIDWLVEVHWKFKLVPETLYLTVNLIDRYLEQCPNLSRTRLQLVGVTCLLIASKYEDIYPPEMKDIVSICDRTYQRHEVMEMEVDILNTLGFCMTTPSPMFFLLRYAKVMEADEKHFFLSQYCLELALPENSMLRYSASQLAAGALYLSNKLLRKPTAWPPHVAVHCPNSEHDVKVVAKELCALLQVATNEDHSGTQLRAVKKKFQLSKFRSVSRMVLG
ncbi:mitotic cyclin-CYC2, putative [Perkinsus marinus ATCC 50983]|uniref:Mitotic cyclin-CYC2, putative n=1 Tax=Perkinsus marinus (strain ATCC 50983 / TXsc) TaxID=423536 RepID=C5L001_PERM5|nr:mitotic cyclin-CYC2, putative [Perkinsus marinus ATCC 50983]EER09859.1 mitotic cyclin-CYC2, putative [Perkinsus marinus ATCC 50983]|eukprot:XP_002778064.1 mitotic cyclin-CYC2, putative [Perkinsus marinus ATCC 50983]